MKLKEYREKNGFTQEEIAKILGVGRQTYIYYEAEVNPIPINKLLILVKKYNITPNDLINYETKTTDEEKEIIKKAIKLIEKSILQ